MARTLPAAPKAAAKFSLAKKHGPPLKSGARYPSGDLRPANDGLTDEHKRHRCELVGSDDPKKQTLASHELGVRRAKRDISWPQFDAGLRYGRLFRAAVRPLTIASVLGNLVASGDGGLGLAIAALEYGSDAERGARDRSEFLAARRALGRCGSRIAGIVDEIAVYDHPCAAAKGEANHADFRRGLDALHAHFDLVDARRRPKGEDSWTANM